MKERRYHRDTVRRYQQQRSHMWHTHRCGKGACRRHKSHVPNGWSEWILVGVASLHVCAGFYIYFSEETYHAIPIPVTPDDGLLRPARVGSWRRRTLVRHEERLLMGNWCNDRQELRTNSHLFISSLCLFPLLSPSTYM